VIDLRAQRLTLDRATVVNSDIRTLNDIVGDYNAALV
jgi:hypothetical protein